MNISKATIADLRKFPHMSPVDIEVWKRFLLRYPTMFSNLQYDVRVGKGIPPLANVSDTLKRDWLLLTQKRIDVVGYSSGQIGIIEVKGTAGTTAPGQPVAYSILFKNHFHPVSAINPILVCSSAGVDVMTIAHAMHVQVFIV